MIPAHLETKLFILSFPHKLNIDKAVRPTAAFKELTVEKREKKKICPTSHEIIMDLTQRPRRRSTHHSGGSVTSGASSQHMKSFVRLMSGARKARAGVDLNLQVPPESPQRWESSQCPACEISNVATNLLNDRMPPWRSAVEGKTFFFFLHNYYWQTHTSVELLLFLLSVFPVGVFFLYSFIECFSWMATWARQFSFRIVRHDNNKQGLMKKNIFLFIVDRKKKEKNQN